MSKQSQRTLSIALGASLLFNVSVLLGFASSKPSPSPSPQSVVDSQARGFDRLGGELNLDEAQRATLQTLEQQRRESSTVFEEGNAVMQQRLADAIQVEQPDLGQIRDVVNQQVELDRQRRLSAADLLDQFLHLLTPPQRLRMHQRIGAAPRPPGMSPAIFARFDSNGDGRLDPAERRHADQEFRNKHRDLFRGGPPRPPIWPWFDADGDGRLNDEERDERDRFVQSHPLRR